MRIGILKCGQSPEPLRDEIGDYDDMFESFLGGRGFEFARYHVEAMQFPASVHDADGWIISGSRHGVYEDHPFIPPLEAFIRRAHDAGVPLVGICFGHQIIAQALGGEVAKHPGGWAIGAQDYDFGGQPVTLNAWHQDQVARAPEGAQVAATSPFCANAALIYGDRAFTVQAHPEFDSHVMRRFADIRDKDMPADLIAGVRSRLGDRIDSQPLADRIEAFFRQPRQTLARAV